MKRRAFLSAGAAGALAASLTGCSSGRKFAVKEKFSDLAFDKIVPKPQGTMPYGVLGKTGIKVPKFGFGSHVRTDVLPYTKEREAMIREGHEYGITFFDVYDKEQNCFQYEPMGRYLKPVINDVTISISFLPYDNRSVEQQFERDLKAFGRDYIDLVRIHSYSSKSKDWAQWEQLFKWKEQGKIRAVGIPIHGVEELTEPIATYPLDYVIFPYNFYHNWAWLSYEQSRTTTKDFDSLGKQLKAKNIGIIAMKPFASEWLITPMMELGDKVDRTGQVNVAIAALKYVLNSDLKPDIVIGGMYYPFHVRENVQTVFNPKMTLEETDVLMKIRDRARIVAENHLPDHYRFLQNWAPDHHDNRDLLQMV